MKRTSLHILIIGLNWPEPNSSAAGSRMLQLIRLFKEKDWKVSFACPAKSTGYEENLKDWGINQLELLPNDSKADQILRNLNPDIVVFDRFMMEEQFGWRVAENCPDALRILDTEDLHFLRKARQLALKEKRDLELADLMGAEAKREIASLMRSDLGLVISSLEYSLLLNQFNMEESALLYLPFLYDNMTEGWAEDFPEFGERTDFMFVGNFLHAPNADAVLYLKKEIWPRIRKQLPQANLHIYGAYTPQKIKQLDKRSEGFCIEDRAVDLPKHLQQHRIMLAPLRFGAGLKGKFFDAMQNGLPSMTTSIGAEGIALKEDFPGYIANNPDEIAQKAVQLYQNEAIWYEKQQKTRGLINSSFSYHRFQNEFYQRLEKALNHINDLRQQNFIGQMLMHHRQQSTKFLSRWIEVKNQLMNQE